MRDDLGITLCESLVTTKLRYVQKSVEISGTQKMQLVIIKGRTIYSQRVSARTVVTELNVPNGELRMKRMVSGVA